MDVCGGVCVVLGWLVLILAGHQLTEGTGLQLPGDYSIYGLFPLHKLAPSSSNLPDLGACKEGKFNKHGYHLIQAMRFALEEINNGTKNQHLLPGVSLGYQAYDTCNQPASVLATLAMLAQQYQRTLWNNTGGDQRAVAVIGPDSSSYTFTPAAVLGSYLVPQISYEASNEMLSNKLLYPAFFRTIPSDKNQVDAMVQLLVRFNWTWIVLLGSDDSYGLQGIESLSLQAAHFDICIAYQGVIPELTSANNQTMRNIVKNIVKTKVNTIVVFSSKTKVSQFFPFVIEQGVTGKVWIGTEDWSVTTLVSGIPGIHTIGTVLGISIKYTAITGFEEFESHAVPKLLSGTSNGTMDLSVECLQNTDLSSVAPEIFSLGDYDIKSSYNVYKAVYAVAHALHQALGCGLGKCQKSEVLPWQLLPLLKQVRFSVGNSSIYFNENGDPPTGYDIVTWIWRGTEWSLREVGSYTADPNDLTVDPAQIEWGSDDGYTGKEVPPSICSPECPKGHRKLQTGQHKCCFDCLACAAHNFLNKTGFTRCQMCELYQWSPAESEVCLDRAVLVLAWGGPLSIALLLFLALTLLMTLGTGVIFLLNLGTPVVKSAGGHTCLVMLLALTVAAASALCHFGLPSQTDCLLKQPLFVFSFTVCLACVTVRSFQVVCIFKLSSKLPRAYDTWTKNHGPEVTVLVVSMTVLLISVLRVTLNPPYPSQDVEFYSDSIVTECSNTLSFWAMIELAYVSLLSMLCFSFSYMGKDLPANYNEAKCITFSLMIYMISWISFFTIYFVSRGEFAMAMHVLAIVSSVLGILGGYFMPKVYIMVLRPQMNTTAHFQNCIQIYTMHKD
ncbi:taste receptor type 1 member 1-like [Salvelinus sp. IW2-2015]|uniref:taste receptor type 1 member 1-like n=1 Tax=Salvelinus sp. IW2-2015 TaxID=2691554 RepID=UPI000CDFB6EF|nr:taste receptor type 1 member 1-like [Salvelinus alpinus]